MQEEVNQKTIALAKSTAKLTSRVLAEMMRRYLAAQAQKKRLKQNQQHNQPKQGKTTLRKLQQRANGDGLSTIEITDQNIKSFERVAKKYGVSFSLKKDMTQNPPKYIVFFRGKDVDVITQAFREYTALELAKANRKQAKPSIRRRLAQAQQKERQASSQQKERKRAKEAEQAL